MNIKYIREALSIDEKREKKRQKRKQSSELPWTGLNWGEDKGKGIETFNHLNGADFANNSGAVEGGCSEDLNLKEDLLVIENNKAKETLDSIVDQIKRTEDKEIKKSLMTLMDVYLFQTCYESDHPEETNCNIDNKQWDEYSDFLKSEATKLDEKLILEGCWGMPQTIEEIKKLKNLMMKPVDAFEVGDCIPSKNDELGIGDDTLFDHIGKYRREHPYGTKASHDVRKVIQDFIKDYVLPGWDDYGYSKNNPQYGEPYWEDGVKEVFQEIAEIDLKKTAKDWEKECEEAQKKAEVEAKPEKPIV